MKLRIYLFLMPIIFSNGYAQKFYKRPKPKNSFAQGTLDFSFGYNNTSFSKSTLKFKGNQYDFQLQSVAASDRNEPYSLNYLAPSNFNVPQFNIRIGYNFKNFWNISFGIDNMKYRVLDGQSARISGYIAPGIDPLWSGYFNDGQERVLQTNHFQYHNAGGINLLRLQVSRNLAPLKKFRDGAFAINWMYGLGASAVLSITDFNFEGYRSERVSSLSGYSISAHTGLRFIFFKNFFLQSNFAGGLIHQVKVSTRPNGGSSASQFMAYGSVEGLFGILVYLKPTNDCNSCPKW
jgi:hypothetical protein